MFIQQYDNCNYEKRTMNEHLEMLHKLGELNKKKVQDYEFEHKQEFVHK